MTKNGTPGFPGTVTVILALLACFALIVVPSSAVTRYLDGAPSFSAAVNGVNEFAPGEDAVISILVKNSGINGVKQVDRGTIEPEDLPNTAKTVTIGLTSGNDDLIVRTDPRMAGDIHGGDTVIVQYHVKISANATAGEYRLPLSLKYRYLRVINQEAADVFEFTYNQAEDTLPVTIRIKPRVTIEVIEAVPEQLSAGSQGYLNLKIRNKGPENGEMASVKLLRNGQSPLIPSDSTTFIGAFQSGGIFECRYKISVAKDATNQTYPVDIAVTYTNREGTIVTSSLETVGVPVKGKTVFTVTSPMPQISPGSGRTIGIMYRNEGCVTAWNAQARITAHNPVSIADNTAFLGNLEPGETAVARYEIQADTDANPGEYRFDSTIRYRDTLGTSHESDTMIVPIAIVTTPSGISSVPGGFPVLAVCIIAGIILIAWLVYRQKMGRR
jgi:hypothetical protein